MKLTVRQAARLLTVTESELYRWVDGGEIPFHMVNHQPLFSREELLEWATAHQLPLSIELFADEGAMVPLAEALARGGIHHGVGGGDRDGVLRAVVDCLPIDDADDRETVLHVMVAREVEVAMRIARGVATPHVRAPLVFAGRPAAVVLCFLAAPVGFGSPDDPPVGAVFSILSPTIRGHLQLLSRLSLGLHDESFAGAVAAQAARDTILDEARRVDASLVTR